MRLRCSPGEIGLHFGHLVMSQKSFASGRNETNDCQLERFIAGNLSTESGLRLRHGAISTLRAAIADGRHRLQIAYCRNRIQEKTNPFVYTGLAGVAFALHYSQSEESPDECVREIARAARRQARDESQSLFCGSLGILLVCALIDNTSADAMASEILACSPADCFEILYGQAGALRGLHLLKRIVKPKSLEKRINDSMKRIASRIIRHGLNEHGTLDPPKWTWHGKAYIGMAHGYAGIFYALLQARQVLTPAQRLLVLDGVEHLVNRFKLESGNFMSSASSTRDELVQWCHGAPGVVPLLVEAHGAALEAGLKRQAQLFAEEAHQAAEVVWQRGVLTKGPGLCHGICGNGYALLAVYRLTGDLEFLAKALWFGLTATQWAEKQASGEWREADRPLSLMEGLAGALCFWKDLLSLGEQQMCFM